MIVDDVQCAGPGCQASLKGRQDGTRYCSSGCRAAASRLRASNGEVLPEGARARTAAATAARYAPKRTPRKRGPQPGVHVYLPSDKVANKVATVLLARAIGSGKGDYREACAEAAGAINKAIQRKRARKAAA